MNSRHECIEHQNRQRYFHKMSTTVKKKDHKKYYQNKASEAYKLMWGELKYLIKVKE